MYRFQSGSRWAFGLAVARFLRAKVGVTVVFDVTERGSMPVLGNAMWSRMQVVFGLRFV